MIKKLERKYYWDNLGDVERDILWDIAEVIGKGTDPITDTIPEFNGGITITIEYDKND